MGISTRRETLNPWVPLPIESEQVYVSPKRGEVRALLLLLLLSVACSLFSGCKVYTFTGTSMPGISSVTIQNFVNRSENGNTLISQNLTDLLKSKFLSDTNLKLTADGGDVEFSGVITGYNIRGQAPTADQTTALNRLTITVKADYVNNVDPLQNWSKTFTRYADYDSARNLADVEAQLMTEINTQIAEDIFNNAFVNW